MIAERKAELLRTKLAIIRKKQAMLKGRSSFIDFIRYTAPWFKVNWHHELVCAVLERVDGTVNEPTVNVSVNGVPVSLPLPPHITRLIVCAPPRHSKSELLSVRRPAYSIGKDCKRMFMSIAYGSDLALTFSKACVGTMLSEAYKRLFPHIKFDRKANERWKVARPQAEDNQRDSMIASGILSPLTGEGATDVNVDDPFKNKSEAYSKLIRDKVYDEYQTSIRTRLQRGATVCLMLTRWHNDDLAARLIKLALSKKNADQWHVLVLAATNDDGQRSYLWDTKTGVKTMLPVYDALWPGLFTREDLDTTRASMSDAFWQAMYMQAPTTSTGSIFKADKWREFTQPIFLERCIHVWDTALESTDEADYSAHGCLGVADGRFIVHNSYRDRLEFPDLVRKVYELWDGDLAAGLPLERLLIEQKGSGISLLQTIDANNVDPEFLGSRVPVLGMPAVLSKVVRALSVSGYQEAGLCSLPAPVMDDRGNVDAVPWVADFINELTEFPRGTNDDQVDWFVHGLTYYTRPHPDEEHTEVLIDDDHHVRIQSELDDID